MIIRRATKSDTQNLVEKLAEFDEHLHPFFREAIIPFVTYKDRRKTFEAVVKEWLNNSDYMIFVAEDEEKLLGHICGTIKAKEFRIKNKEGSIEEWFVSSEYRHKGIGKQLYDILLTEFKKANCTHVALKVFSDNKHAIDLYHKMSFMNLEL